MQDRLTKHWGKSVHRELPSTSQGSMMTGPARRAAQLAVWTTTHKALATRRQKYGRHQRVRRHDHNVADIDLAIASLDIGRKRRGRHKCDSKAGASPTTRSGSGIDSRHLLAVSSRASPA